MNMDTLSKYAYIGVPLTPGIAKDLIKKHFSNQKIRRRDLCLEIIKIHKESGGADANSNIYNILKKALKQLSKEHKAICDRAYGYWMIFPEQDTVEEVQEKVSPKVNAPIKNKLIAPNALILGEPSQCKGVVYVYHYPTYKNFATTQNVNLWPCKIGYTDAPDLARVNDQMGTSTCELPDISLIIYSDSPRIMEAAIHSFFDACSKRITGLPGREWFLTNPTEILEFVDLIFAKKKLAKIDS